MTGLLSVASDGIRQSVSGSFAGQILASKVGSGLEWLPNHVNWRNGLWWIRENGGAHLDGTGALTFGNAVSGAGAKRTYLTAEKAWFQNAGSIETGTSATGSASIISNSTTSVIFAATSGAVVYEATFGIPVLSSSTQRFKIIIGFSDLTGLGTDTVTLQYSDNLNSGKFQFEATSASTQTTADTGVTPGAGDYFRARIVVTNATKTECFLVKTYDASVGSPAWADTGDLGAAKATITTNIPTVAIKHLLEILSSVGTTSKVLKIGYHCVSRTPPFTQNQGVKWASTGLLSGGDGLGFPVGDSGTQVVVNETAGLNWSEPMTTLHPIVFKFYEGFDLGGNTTGGTGASGTVAYTATANGFLRTRLMSTGTAVDGYGSYSSSPSITVDGACSPLIVEAAFSIPTLSAVAQQFALTIGILSSVIGAANTDGAWLEIDSFANANAQCKTSHASTTTTTDSGLVINAATSYVVRIVITGTQVDFYLKADGAASFGTPVASHTTNLPSATGLYIAATTKKILGATSRTSNLMYLLGLQRSTT